MTLPLLLRIAGLGHFALLTASASVACVLDWRHELGRISRLSRQLVWTHGAFLVLTIIGFGALTLLNAPALAAGTPLARTFCGFIAFFWFARLCLQLCILDHKPHLTNLALKLGFHSLTILFSYFTLIYAYAALHR